MVNGKLLSEVKVVELATFNFVPTCTKIFADLGAKVIKVDNLKEDRLRSADIVLNADSTEDENSVFNLENSNEESISIDLKSESGIQIMKKLISSADVFVTNLKSCSLEKLGLSYAQLKEEFPSLIFAQIGK